MARYRKGFVLNSDEVQIGNIVDRSIISVNWTKKADGASTIEGLGLTN